MTSPASSQDERVSLGEFVPDLLFVHHSLAAWRRIKLTRRDAAFALALLVGAGFLLWLVIDIVARYHCPWDKLRCDGW